MPLIFLKFEAFFLNNFANPKQIECRCYYLKKHLIEVKIRAFGGALERFISLDSFYLVGFSNACRRDRRIGDAVYHCSESHNPLFVTTSNGSYDVRRIQKSFFERQRKYLPFCHAFTGCDAVSAITGHGKTASNILEMNSNRTYDCFCYQNEFTYDQCQYPYFCFVSNMT